MRALKKFLRKIKYAKFIKQNLNEIKQNLDITSYKMLSNSRVDMNFILYQNKPNFYVMRLCLIDSKQNDFINKLEKSKRIQKEVFAYKKMGEISRQG